MYIARQYATNRAIQKYNGQCEQVPTNMAISCSRIMPSQEKCREADYCDTYRTELYLPCFCRLPSCVAAPFRALNQHAARDRTIQLRQTSLEGPACHVLPRRSIGQSACPWCAAIFVYDHDHAADPLTCSSKCTLAHTIFQLGFI